MNSISVWTPCAFCPRRAADASDVFRLRREDPLCLLFAITDLYARGLSM